jgi:hypothetical protein
MFDEEQELCEVRKFIKNLEAESGEIMNHAKQQQKSIYIFIGKLSQILSGISIIESSSDLSETVQNLRRKYNDLDSKMKKYKTQDREKTVLSLISQKIGHYASFLGLEKSSELISFIIKELALLFSDKEGNKSYLWEVGSGENWMGYHIALLLSLHEYCVNDSQGVVLPFLVIDQPTQVYFPGKDDAYEKAKQNANMKSNNQINNLEINTNYEKQKKSVDISKEEHNLLPFDNEPGEIKRSELKINDFEKAERIFEVLSESIKITNKSIQIIVTEHADSFVYGKIQDIHQVDEWREGRSLIPAKWLESGD